MSVRTYTGNSPRRKGDRIECMVVDDQERVGRVAFRVRQGGGEPVDVVALAYVRGSELALPYFIQVKASSPYLRPVERELLIEKAKQAGAIPMVAWLSKESKRLEYKVLEGES